MKLARCPVCHSDIHLDQLLEDDAGRDLLRIITETKYEVARPLVSYIALFRPAKSALSNSRAVKLMNEVLALYQPSLLLAHALSETVAAVQKKRRDHSNCAPLANHEYLKPPNRNSAQGQRQRRMPKRMPPPENATAKRKSGTMQFYTSNA